MLNPSDVQLDSRATLADNAQLLRGRSAFGAVAFKEGVALQPDQVWFDAGYADCLPVWGGGVWRDPKQQATAEAIR